MTAASASTTRPGGRSARVRTAVHRAVEELVAEPGADDLTIPVVAARAGVHPTTVYRRWGSVAELLTAVAGQRFGGADGDVLVPDTGTLRGDLERWAADVARDVTDPEVLALMRATVGVGGDSGADACIVYRHEQLAEMISRERERGGSPPSVGAAADAVLAPLYYRALFAVGLDDPPRPARLVAALLG